MRNKFYALLAFAGMLATQSAWAQADPSAIDYKAAGINAETAQATLNDEIVSVKLGQSVTGVYCMRGGKDGNPPVSHAYQYQYCLDTDNYAQYFVISHKDFPYANNTITTTYNISGFNGAGHSGYNLMKQAIPALLTDAKVNNIPEIKAIFLLYFNLAAQENADISGPFTYNEDKANSEDPRTYQSLKEVYYNIKKDIDNCIACWEYYDANRDEAYKAVIEKYLATLTTDAKAQSDFDYYGKKYKHDHRFVTFMHLANSLQLRMAMHMAKVEPTTAKAWAEEAVKRGVVANVMEQQGIYPTNAGFAHPLAEILTTWNDNRLSASFESLLMSLDHPYTKYLFLPNENPIENIENSEITPAQSRIVGIRSGSFVGDGQAAGSNPFINYSSLDKEAILNAPLYFVSYAETCFLRAEGALRGWNMGGTAQSFYEEGIRYASIEDPYYASEGWYDTETSYVDYVEEYMAKESATEYTQVDPQGLGEPWPSVTKIGVKWNESDSQETKLEKIITQKYIALFPDSHEAWAELRRTGYPKMFAVLNAADGDGSIKQGDMIRRAPYRFTDPVQLGYWEATGLPALGGPDVQATRLWWDVDCGNFEGSESGVESVTMQNTTAGKTYSIDGRIVNSNMRGIMIRDGKKIVK